MPHGFVPRVALAVLITLTSAVHADVLAPGTKSVRFVCKVQLDESCRSLRTSYRVREGDTLSKIAARQLGRAARYPEISALNPELEPDRLKIGQRLWLPPMVPKKDAPAEELWVLDLSFGHQPPQPFELGAELTFYRAIRFVIVPSERRAEFLAQYGINRGPDLSKLSWVLATDPVHARNTALITSDIHSSELTVELRRKAAEPSKAVRPSKKGADQPARTFAAEQVSLTHRNKQGAEIAAPSGPPKSAALSILGLAALAFGWRRFHRAKSAHVTTAQC